MHITRVNNINFNGNFHYNLLLDAVLESANSYELQRFDNLLAEMNSVIDGKNYVLDTKTDPLTRTKELFIRDNMNESSCQFYKSIGTWAINQKANFSDCLERITSYLESIYKPKKVETPRDVLLMSVKSRLL